MGEIIRIYFLSYSYNMTVLLLSFITISLILYLKKIIFPRSQRKINNKLSTYQSTVNINWNIKLHCTNETCMTKGQHDHVYIDILSECFNVFSKTSHIMYLNICGIPQRGYGYKFSNVITLPVSKINILYNKI